jgi:hypothetical protein
VTETIDTVVRGLKVDSPEVRAQIALRCVGNVPIVYSGRLKRTLGSCKSSSTNELGERAVLRIVISKLILELPEVLRQTLLHEIAHALAGHDAGHGPEWQDWARKLGVSTDRLMSIELPKKLDRKHVATCRQCGHKLYRHRRMASGKVWIHTKCGGMFSHVEH